MVVIPERVAAGPVQLVLHGPEEAAAIADAINDSLEHLAPWMQWAHRPTNAQEQAMRLAMVGERARAGEEGVWSIVDADGAVVGGCGLHQRSTAEEIDIGYWLAAGATGKGYATAAAAALTRIGFEVFERRVVRITCDAANERSAAVPRRLEFELVSVEEEPFSSERAGRATMLWQMSIERWPESPGFAIDVSYA